MAESGFGQSNMSENRIRQNCSVTLWHQETLGEKATKKLVLKHSREILVMRGFMPNIALSFILLFLKRLGGCLLSVQNVGCTRKSIECEREFIA